MESKKKQGEWIELSGPIGSCSNCTHNAKCVQIKRHITKCSEAEYRFRCPIEIFAPDGSYDSSKEPTKLAFVKVDLDTISEFYEILCDIPFEKATMADSEPPTERHPAVESMIEQLGTIIESTDEDSD